MQERTFLGLSEALPGIKAMLRAAKEQPGRPIAAAVMDAHGDLVAFACEAGANPALARQNALKKAYTAACMRVDTVEYGRRSGAPQSNLTGGQGGLVIVDPGDGSIMGGVGVSGRSGDEDEAIAHAGLQVVLELLRKG